MCFVRRNLLLRTLPFHFGHVTLNEVPQVPGIIMHFLDNTLMPFVAPLLGRPMLCAVLTMQQASSNKLPTVILHSSVSFAPLPILHRSLHVPAVSYLFRSGLVRFFRPHAWLHFNQNQILQAMPKGLHLSTAPRLLLLPQPRV